MRAGWVAAIAVPWFGSSAAGDGVREEPRLFASGFVGYSTFGDTQLGNSWAREQVPEPSAVLGARLGWLAVPELVRRGPLELSLTVETELAIAVAATGGSPFDDERERRAYFAPVFGWRAHALVRQPIGARRALALHAVIGAGGATVASSSPFMAKETDPLAYGGVGFTYAVSPRWQVRIDGRQGIMPGRSSSATRVSELHLGLFTTFGLATRRDPPPPPPAPPPAVAPDPTDTDGDGLPDHLDRCPGEPETINGIADDDGCPEPDPDADGVIGPADLCPMEAEDIDGFEDDDGCPDRDNDGDGIEDARDVCPDDPETRNGYADADGCPDTIPEAVTRALSAAAAVRFEPGRARVTPAAKRALQPVLALLKDDRDVAIAIAGMPERAGGEELAKRRAEAVKWYLVDQGIAEDRIDAAVGPVGGRSPIAIELR